MPSTTDKRLTSVDADAAKRMANDGYALTLKQLALAVGYSYDVVRFFAKQDGFPLLRSKVTLEDYRQWRKRKLGLESSPDIAARPQSSIAGKSGKSRG